MSINSGDRLTSINEKSIPLWMSNKGKTILAPESDCESCGSNSGVCNASLLISLKRGSKELIERDADDNFFHLVKPKRRSMQKFCECRSGLASHAVLWSLRQHIIQASPMSLPSIYRNYSFWDSVANLANTQFELNLNVDSALGLATQMKEGGCVCGEAKLLFSNTIDCGPVIVPQFSELIMDPSEFISDELLPYVNDFVNASHSHTTFHKALGLLDPKVNPIVQVGTSHALVTSTPSEPGPPTKKRKATVDEVLSLLMECKNLPRPTIYAAMQKFENKSMRKVWMNDSLENKLDFLEEVTPKRSMRAFIYWRNGPEVSFLS